MTFLEYIAQQFPDLALSLNRNIGDIGSRAPVSRTPIPRVGGPVQRGAPNPALRGSLGPSIDARGSVDPRGPAWDGKPVRKY